MQLRSALGLLIALGLLGADLLPCAPTAVQLDLAAFSAAEAGELPIAVPLCVCGCKRALATLGIARQQLGVPPTEAKLREFATLAVERQPAREGIAPDGVADLDKPPPRHLV